jgi:tetratricopeptide (TPR) repeat protein
MATTTVNMFVPTFSSSVPFSIFRKDFKQYSLGDIKDEDSKTFVWHQFMLDVLLNMPRSLTDNEDVIAASHQVNEIITDDPIQLKQTDIDEFRTTYASDKAINWYTRDSFLYRSFNKACRTHDSDVIVQFHSIVKDLNVQLKQLHVQQKKNGTLVLPMTVYRAQSTWGIGELEKLRASEGNLISMNTFLSTTVDSGVACAYISGADKDASVLFQITINDTQNDKQLQTFAQISQDSAMAHEKEVLFSMSSVFRVNSVEEYDCFWVIDLELTNCKEDEDVQKLMNEVKTYVYQISGKQLPFIVFKELFTTTSHGHFRPLTELMQFFLADLTQLFVSNAYKKERQMKELIDKEPALLALMMETSSDVIRSNEASICLLFDLLNRFLYLKEKKGQEEISFNMNDSISLLCFGGFLIITGETNKSIRYFEILLKNDSIDDKLKLFIQAILGTIYANTEEKELAAKYSPSVLQLFQSSMKTLMPSSLAALFSSSYNTLYGPDQQANQTSDLLKLFMNKKQSYNDPNEKLRLLLLGHSCQEQQNCVDALNHWEEALEITSYISSSIRAVLDGTIYIQMASAYIMLSNVPETLNSIEKGLKYLESYYPSTHKMFALFNFMYGYSLIQNERPLEGMARVNKSLENPYVSNDKEFLGVAYSIMALGAIQSGNVDLAEQYCYKAIEYQSPTNISVLVPTLLETLPHLKQCIDSLGIDFGRQCIGMSMQLGQQVLSEIVTNPNTLLDFTNEQTCAADNFIMCADHYRHRQDYTRAETYYNNALDKLTEMDATCMWNIYRKMMRMNNNDYDRYQGYFIEQYSKYDDNNFEHFEMIATLQVIMYKLCLSQNEVELAFDCLIYGTFIAIKFLYHQISVDSNYISDLFNRVFHQSGIAKASDILTKLIQMYSINWKTYIQHFLLTYFASDDLYAILAKIIHHSQIDDTLDQMKSKHGDCHSSKSLFLFLNTLLEFLRQSIISPEKSTLSFSDQFLELLRKYNDETAPMFYLMKVLESFIIGNTGSFLFNLDKFRVKTITFERYKELKEKISYVFGKLDEDQLFIYLESIAKNL